MAPKITLFNGQHALIQSEVQRPFVTGVRPNVLAGGKMDPVIEVVHEGWRMLLHAKATEEEGVELQCVLTRADSNVLSADAATDRGASGFGRKVVEQPAKAEP